MPTILAIESSCDDTSAAIIRDGVILSNVTATQTIHELYGGVVPEVASRKHQVNLIPVVRAALDKAQTTKNQLDAIAVTKGPGLLGSLIVGVSFAKALALSLDIPLIDVHHMKAHVLAHFAEDPKPRFPFLCLTVSGGHTQIVRIDSPSDMTVLGTTIDDAAGEAFDKSGKIMGLKYPAGAEMDRLASQGTARFSFAKPKIDGLDFSFSGLKTSILYFLRDQLKTDENFIDKNLKDICASIQETIVSILMEKLTTAAEMTGISEIAIAGGVSANSGLRTALHQAGSKNGWNVYIPAFQYCTDNAGMIAVTAHFDFLEGVFADLTLIPAARLSL